MGQSSQRTLVIGHENILEREDIAANSELWDQVTCIGKDFVWNPNKLKGILDLSERPENLLRYRIPAQRIRLNFLGKIRLLGQR